MKEVYTEKEILGDALAAQKAATANYNMMANECVHDGVRQAILEGLEQEHEIQVQVFDAMHTRGFYPTPCAEKQKVEEAKQKFAQCVKKA